MRYTRTKARVGLEEGVHTILIPRQNDDEIVALVLHHLEQDFYGFLPIVTFVLLTVKVVGLVNEEHTAHGPLEHFFGFRRSMADVLSDQVIARHRHKMSLAHIVKPVQDHRHTHGHRRLPGAWRASKRHMQRWW